MEVHKLFVRGKRKYSGLVGLLSEDNSIWMNSVYLPVNCCRSWLSNLNKKFVVFSICKTKHYQLHHGHLPHQTLMKRDTAALFHRSCEAAGLQLTLLADSTVWSCCWPSLYAISPNPCFHHHFFLLFHCICQTAT